MKLIEKIKSENHGMADVLTGLVNKYADENKIERIYTVHIISYFLRAWGKGELGIKNKTLLLPCINELLGSNYTISDLDSEIGLHEKQLH